MYNRNKDLQNDRLGIIFFLGFLWGLFVLSGCGGGDIPLATTNLSGKVTLSWKNIPNAKSYNVYLSRSPGVTKYNSHKISQATNPITISDLEPGDTYYFIVTVVDDSGESLASKELSYTAVKNTTGSVDFKNIVDEPMSQQAGSQTNKGRVTLTWDNVEGVNSYNIYWNTSPGVNIHNSNKIVNVENPHTINDLERGTTYYFVVTGVNKSGESQVSEEISYTVPE
jgi:fibronectin type 3 domain-containing protein